MMYMSRKLAYNKKGTLNFACLSVAKIIWLPPNSLDELGALLI